MNEEALAAIEGETRTRLRELEDGLARALGDNLAALVVYGSAARGGYRAGRSDIDLLVVLKEASRPALLSVANALQVARYAARIEAMILTEGEIAQATDVFPILYDDIRRHHVVLRGSDPFASLSIDDRHRRLRIEQELREAQIRLRRAVIDGSGGKDALAGAVLRKAKQIRAPLHALLRLRGIPCEDRSQPLLAKAGEVYRVDTSPILRAAEDPEKAHDALVAVLSAAIADVDAMETR